jgi:DNA-binding response OmpR family regulator
MVSVLVVDDEHDIREAVAEVLADEGYVVHGASDGAEALRTARAVRPDIVLLDLMMPGMNGWEFRAAQKCDPDIQDIPVVVLSALGRVAGMDAAGFIQKPFDLEELLAVVREHAQEEPGVEGGTRAEAPRHAPM